MNPTIVQEDPASVDLYSGGDDKYDLFEIMGALSRES